MNYKPYYLIKHTENKVIRFREVIFNISTKVKKIESRRIHTY